MHVLHRALVMQDHVGENFVMRISERFKQYIDGACYLKLKIM